MNGPIAQLVALTCHLNAVIKGLPTERFFPDHSTALFCERIWFTEPRERWFGPSREEIVARHPDAWFGLVCAQQATGCRLVHTTSTGASVPERNLAGFIGGGGNWFMEVDHQDGTCVWWDDEWAVGDEHASERRIWRVGYRRIGGSRSVQQGPSDLAAAAARLERSLVDIRSFSATHANGFTATFDAALDSLRSNGKHMHGHHRDLAPPTVLSPAALAILDACQAAWVFGGMGSWNDMGFDGDDGVRYDHVSDQLYRSVCAAIIDATNSSAPAHR